MTRRIALALPLAAACTAHPLAEPVPRTEQQTNVYVDAGSVREADILFVIDNSGSMRQEQDKLRRNFPAFMQELARAAGGRPSVHIGIVSTDMGAGPTPVAGGCERVAGDRGLLRVKPGCGLDPNARWIVAGEDEVRRNYQGDLGAVFACLADLGTTGCGFEHPLQAARVALYPQRGLNEANQGFLRRDAYLAIVLVTDEDDCSGPPDSDLYTQAFPGQSANLRCAVAGHVCRNQPPPATAGFAAPMSECRAAERGRLIAIDELVRDIRALKPRPDQQILVAGIYGLPEAGASYRIQRDERQDLEVAPVCGDPRGDGTAAAGLRVRSFVEAFGESGASFSICERDFHQAMTRIGEKLGRIVGSGACVSAPLVDVQPRQPGVQPDCIVSDQVPVAGSAARETPIPPCDGAPPTSACWRAVADAGCSASGYKIEVDRRGGTAAPGALLAIRCQTCPAPGDPHCAR